MNEHTHTVSYIRRERATAHTHTHPQQIHSNQFTPQQTTHIIIIIINKTIYDNRSAALQIKSALNFNTYVQNEMIFDLQSKHYFFRYNFVFATTSRLDCHMKFIFVLQIEIYSS